MTSHIFISYNKQDKDFTAQLADDLQEYGFKVWYDPNIGGGEQWKETIVAKLKSAEEVIVVLSPNSIDSDWVQYEGSMASVLGKNIYPILIANLRVDQNLPPWMERIQYINFAAVGAGNG